MKDELRSSEANSPKGLKKLLSAAASAVALLDGLGIDLLSRRLLAPL
jgi:hypothetical protein